MGNAAPAMEIMDLREAVLPGQEGERAAGAAPAPDPENGSGGDNGQVSTPVVAPLSPVFFFDVKGPTWERGKACQEPLEVSGVLLENLHGKVLSEASTCISYPLTDIGHIRKRCHVSVIKEGGLMDRVEQASKDRPVLNAAFKHTQVFQFFKAHVFDALKDAGKHGGNLYMPIWNAWYESCSIPSASTLELHRIPWRLRVIEMQDLSAMLVDEFGLEYPERDNWTGIESVRWYMNRTRELFPARRKRSTKKKKPE